MATQKVVFEIDEYKHMVLKYKCKTEAFNMKDKFREAVESLVTETDIINFRNYAQGKR